MLRKLSVQNYALIEEVTIDFSNGLNILTGETGAGKSILLGAMGLILGRRADTTVLFNKEKKCLVEAQLETSNFNVDDFYTKHDLDNESPLILRREISNSGRSRAFINDTPVNLSVMSELGARLVEMHEQFDHLQIRETDFHRESLDAMAQTASILSDYKSVFIEWDRAKKQFDRLQNQNVEQKKHFDFIQFQSKELEEASLVSDEENSIQEELKTLNNAESIKSALASVSGILSVNEPSIVDGLREAAQSLRDFQDSSKIHSLEERIFQIISEAEDISNTADELLEKTEYDPVRIEELDDRLALLFKLFQKHQVQSSEELIKIEDGFNQWLFDNSSNEAELSRLAEKIKSLSGELKNKGESLRKKRKAVVPSFEKTMKEKLSYLGMEEARISVSMSPYPEPGPNGLDEIEFLFSGNAGVGLSSIKSSASGGEISRLNLSLKSAIAGKIDLPILIFDEIDAGVSGEVANRIGVLLQELGLNHQVICITHTPQIAAKGAHHMHVVKNVNANRTNTSIKVLTSKDRTMELAKMLGGDPPSEAAIKNAEALLIN